jgi:hypothetical protein
VAPLGDDGGALYRSLIVVDSAATITVDLHPNHQSRPHPIHRSRCDVPNDPMEAAVYARTLLRVADEAVARALEARGEADMPEGRQRSPWYPAGTSRHEDRHSLPAVEDEHERHLRERAYFLWEREGRPEGHAHEFWERACREEAMTA